MLRRLTLLCAAGLMAASAWLTAAPAARATTNCPRTAPCPTPPSTKERFHLAAEGTWASLPPDSRCSTRVRFSVWEPRPTNAEENNTKPDPQAVHAAFAARPADIENTVDSRWDTWLLPRVDGQFTGTTDEIIQWAACKWGVSDNMLRAIAVQESGWFEGLRYADGQCYWNRGCGDAFHGATADSRTFCDGLAAVGGHDYQADENSTAGAYPFKPGPGLCPKTFSLVGIKAWEAPSWVAPAPPYPGNQNGTFPFSRDSTAFAVDYLGAYLRGCYEGWEKWLDPAGGDIWGCVGSWYAGDWHSTAADDYITDVKAALSSREWFDPTFDDSGHQYHCDPAKGCPS